MTIDRYKLTYERKMASKGDLRAFVLHVLESEGLDPAIVNFKEEGVSIEALNKLCRALYEVGYKDGLEESSLLVGKRREDERSGKSLIRHQRIAKGISENNQINKII